MNYQSCTPIYSSEYQEFFYKEDDFPVPEGQLVGFDLDLGEEVSFVLCDEVYWSLGDEEGLR